MGDNQCGLCLSCGAPFMPDLSQTEFFNRDANLSILFLNTQFARNPDIMRSFEVPKLCSERQASHMIHRSYHHTALDYMCNRLRGDRDVGNPAAMLARYRIQDTPNNAFLYYHTATGNAGPRAACWPRPPQDQRLNMRPLLRAIQRASMQPEALPIPQSLAQTYDMCAGCNALMTQKSHMRFLLGVRGAGLKNQRGRILQQPGVIQQFDMTAGRNGQALDRAYGRWRVHQHPHPITSPNLVKADSDAPAIAYYLHLCLPFRTPAGVDGFQGLHANMRETARAHYLQQCWLILEIACLATLLEENTVTKPHSRKSHGMHQHLGALDVYVSYFFWRMIQFRYAVIVNRRGMSFIEWHQKFYCDARNCRYDLLSEHDRRTTTGQLVYAQTDVPARTLVQTIGRRLVNYYRNDLTMLFRHIIGDQYVSRHVKDYFVPVAALRALRDRSIQSVRNDFQSALGKFGISALLFRLIDLCAGYPPAFRNQLLDFRACWQWREIERVRLASPGLDPQAAYRLYYLCTLLDPPNYIPAEKTLADAIFQMHDYSSPWNSVISLDGIGAFTERAGEVVVGGLAG